MDGRQKTRNVGNKEKRKNEERKEEREKHKA